jgi:hypothetical protein
MAFQHVSIRNETPYPRRNIRLSATGSGSRVRPWRRAAAAAATTVLGVALGLVAVDVPAAGAAGPCDPPVVNPVACENTKTGNLPSEWDISGFGSSAIQGFATDISTNQGAIVRFKVKTAARSYRLDIYRMGYYAGRGARKVASVLPSVTLPQSQPSCVTASATGLIDCGNWRESASWAVPADAVSGIYFAKLVRTDGTAGTSHIVFVVRSDASHSDLLFQTSDTTWQAYNTYGGNSLYVGQPAGRAYKVSYNRPITTRGTSAEDFVFNAEYPAVRWLEANGYDVSYSTGVDTDRRGSLLTQHKTFLSVGHDEYWSGGQRANVEAARAAGVNLAFFSGNEIFWKTRWENSIDGTGTPYRTLVTYKETHADDTIDPADPPTWTGTWRDPRFSPPADGGRPENALSGTIFTVNCCTYDMTVGAADGGLRFWRGTRVAALTGSQQTVLGDSILGYEWDEDLDNGARPPGLMRMSSTTVSGVDLLQDYGSSYASGTATHHLTLYRHASGALVFGAGTVQWAWGLDGTHDRGSGTSDVAVQQATVNLFADMGMQPATLQSGLTPAARSTDTTRPASVITSPTDGASVPVGSPTTITGTATDGGGGVVGGVEVSVDGGATWHPANGRSSWSYTWRPTSPDTVTIRSRAVDDSGNVETPSGGVTVIVGGGAPPPATCPCTIWPSSAIPAEPSDADAAAIEIGTKFRSDVSGYVTGIRFYKGTGNGGTHVGHLWTAGGTQLASATFSGESPSGWQQVNLSSPVAINANTTYIASYYAPTGHYAGDDGYFATTGVDSPPLHALRNGLDGPNGVYRYGTGGGFPTSTYQSENYWVDVVFATSAADNTPPTVTARTPTPGATGVATSATVSATFSEPVQSSTITFGLTGPGGTPVAAATAYDASSRTVTLTPSAPLATSTSYTASLSGAQDLAGNTMAPASWSFTTAAAPPPPPPPSGCPCSIWSPTATPGTPSDPDTSAVELGVKFRSDVSGQVTGIRFYKGAGNTGTHVGHLWTSSGTLLATATFTGESATGWQQVTFSSPVPISANTTYVASYYAPAGRYAVDEGFFATSGVDTAPLHALRNGVDGSNGVYRYGTGGGFPTDTWQSSNYWVDIVLTTD